MGVTSVLYIFSICLHVDQRCADWTAQSVGRQQVHCMCAYSHSPGAKGLKWRFFDHESEQAEFGDKL